MTNRVTKEPVHYEYAKRLREVGVGQGLFSKKALKEWKRQHKADGE